MKRRFSECALFVAEYARNFRTTGAILPSGYFLGRALARYVGQTPGPKRILEVGPGTGAVTQRIIARMGPQDRLDLVELNDRFVARLRERLDKEPPFCHVADRTRVLHCPVEELPCEPTYEVIVSGLPLNNFEPAEVEKILASLRAMLCPGGTLSFFEYIAIRHVRAMVSGRTQRERLRAIGHALGHVLDGNEIRRDWILPNVPPAWVHHVRFAR